MNIINRRRKGSDWNLTMAALGSLTHWPEFDSPVAGKSPFAAAGKKAEDTKQRMATVKNRQLKTTKKTTTMRVAQKTSADAADSAPINS